MMRHANLDPSSFITHYQQRIESQLDQHLPEAHKAPSSLHQAMRYSVLNGGKRIRALLLYASGQCCGAAPEKLDIPAVCVECIHAYSLIHDDLPAMDNDDLRRGKPSCHKAFSEATAILAGDALQSLAFELLSQTSPYYDCKTQLNILNTLSVAIGSRGMVGGQMLDMYSENQRLTNDALETLHQLKTAALIRSSVLIGAIAADADQHSLQQLGAFAEAIGIAFQIKDDLLDTEGNTQQLGKTAGIDSTHNKATAINTYGVNAAKERSQALLQTAIDHLTALPYDTTALNTLAHYIIQRNH